MAAGGGIAKRLYGQCVKRAGDNIVKDARIGLGYAGALLSNGSLGLAALLRAELQTGCSLLPYAGRVGGSSVLSILEFLLPGTDIVEKTVGLAVANALINKDAGGEEGDAVKLMKLGPDDRVAMVGFFGPLVERIGATGARLEIIERDPSRLPPGREKRINAVPTDATVVIITATSIINGTIDDVLDSLEKPRHVALLGPSTPLSWEVFAGTPVTHLGGAVPRDTGSILKIISEGGGTPALRPYLRFVNLLRGKTD
ncbi:MAG: DUF364 domain-containing protein [Deltaproteobacteria bacterium]|nr:DUF364 domain-containing protein [Deltaproteobacteria bacterium]